MFCPYCGKQIDDDSKFCPYCGKTIEQPAQKSRSTVRQRQPMHSTNKQSVQLPHLSKKVIIILTAACVAAAIIIGLAMSVKPKINLNDYVTISYDGYDTMGTATASLDIDGLVFAIVGDEGGDEEKQYQAEMAVSALLGNENLEGELDKTEDLKNGDTVTYTWDISDGAKKDIEDKLGYTLKYEDITTTVEGLQEAEPFDPFDRLKVIFSGIQPNGTVEIDDGGDGWYSTFTADPNDGLSNGDNVTIYYTPNGYDPRDNEKALEEYCISSAGKIPTETKKTYTVSGLDAYLTTLSDLTDGQFDILKQETNDTFEAYFARQYDPKYVKTNKMEYVGRYLLTKKKQDTYGNANTLDLIYKITQIFYDQQADSTDKKSHTYYLCASFVNLTFNDKGVTYDSCTVLGDYQNIKVGDDWGTNYSYIGYEDSTAMHTELVTANKADYSVEEDMKAEKSSKKGSTDTDDTKETKEADEGEKDDGRLNNDYILPNSDSKLLTEDDVKNLTLQEINYAKNEIFARHGRKFSSSELQNYFNSKDWYDGTIDPDDFDESVLSSTEKKNAQFLATEEFSRDKNGYQLK